MKFNQNAQFNRRPFNATLQAHTLPDVDVSVNMTAVAYADVYLPTSLKTGGSVSRDLSQKLWTAKVRYNKAVTGGVYSGVWFKNVELAVPDHNGVSRVIFVGFFPSQTSHLEPGNSSEEFTAYDYGWYLTENILEDSQLSLLSPDDQDTSNYQRLDYDYVVNNFTVGKIVQGETSGATGLIVGTQGNWIYSDDSPPESYLVPPYAIVLRDTTGSTFQDDETIKEIGGNGEALANGGAFIPLDFGPGTVYPEDWLYDILGGDNWEKVTGIYPYRLNPVDPVTETWTPMPCDSWFFESTETKQSALDKLSEYHNFVWMTKWKQVAGYSRYLPCGYWVHQDDIDNSDTYAQTEHRGLSLPAAVTVSLGNAYLVGKVELDINGGSRKNKVIVRCQDMSGNWYENTQVAGTTCTSGVYYGEEKPAVYYEENPNLFTQAQAQTRAALLFTYLSAQISTWKCTFRQRTDFELLQKLTFSGYNATEIPDGDYRIIAIEYTFEPAGVFVHVTIINDSQFKAQLKINRVYVNSTLEIQRIIKAELAKRGKDEIGTVLSIDGNVATVQTESGVTKLVRTG